MADPIVLDASAALAILRDEPMGLRVLEILAQQVQAQGDVFVPQHFWLEIGNVLIRRYGYSPRLAVERVRVLDEFGLQTFDLDRTLWLLTLDRMHRLSLAAYDAAYLALAEAQGASLLTLDGALASAAGSRAIQTGPHRLQETPGEYRTSEPGVIWRDFGEYLAELRRAVAAE